MSISSWKARFEAYLQKTSDKSDKTPPESSRTDPFVTFVMSFPEKTENPTFSPGEAVRRIRQTLDRINLANQWQTIPDPVIDFEDRINQAALSGDENRLEKELREYEAYFTHPS